MKKENRFKKFNKNPNKSTSDLMSSSSSTNLLRKKSMSTSALTHINEESADDAFDDDMRKDRKRNSSSSFVNIDNSNETEVRNSISVKELIERMITHLQILERKNELLTLNIKQLSEENCRLKSVETELSESKVELNLYKNRLQQLEQIANEWHCSLCMDNKDTIINSKRLIVSTFCGRVFCSLCAQSLLSQNRQPKQCPTCRKPLKDGQTAYHPIFI
jgi:rubrerythrin